MSRKSVRIQRRKKNSLDTTEQEIIETFRKKRKADDCDGAESIVEACNKKQKTENDSKIEGAASMEITKRRQQFQIQNQWVPISQEQKGNSCLAVSAPTAPISSQCHSSKTSTVTVLESASSVISPHKNNTTPQDFIISSTSPSTVSQFRFKNFFTTPTELKDSPLPSLHWADSREVWQLMLHKEQLYKRDPFVLDRHAALQPRMRSILLDWLIEVCEVYRLHRETYHLAVDFIDRFLSLSKSIQKSQLQLLGITALFVAAKLEEIYPPKLTEFAYVTDSACTENEILDQELVMLKALKWDLCPMTPNSWLNVFLQLMNVENMEDTEHNFVVPQYSQNAFIQIARLLDLCSLDLGSLQFQYSVLTTSATYHMSSEHVALSVSGFEWINIAACVQWMAPFAMTLRETGPVDMKYFQHIPTENSHNIQTHALNLNILENSQNRQVQIVESARASPELCREFPGIITPPQSKGKESKEESTPKSSRHAPLCDSNRVA